MNRLRYLTYLIITIIGAHLFAGCNTSGCLENRSAIPLAGFYSSSSREPISIDSLVITGVGESAPLYDGETPIKEAYLPLRSTSDVTAWEIEYHLNVEIDGNMLYFTMHDTIDFGYSSSPYFASDECGVIYKYQINHMKYTTHLIDSVVIMDSLVTNIDTERIKIYFRTRQPESENE